MQKDDGTKGQVQDARRRDKNSALTGRTRTRVKEVEVHKDAGESS
jgi:ribosomal protein S20